MDVTFDAPYFTAGIQVLAQLEPPLLLKSWDELAGSSFSMSISGVSQEMNGCVVVDYTGPSWGAQDRIERLAPGEYCCERTWRNESAQVQEVVLCCRIEHYGDNLSYLIPAVNYDGNDWGNGQEPKGLYDRTGEGHDSWQALWIFGGDRCSVPACTISEGEGYVVASYATPGDAAQSSCALEPVTGGLRHWLFWPLQERPRTYTQRDTYSPAIGDVLRMAPGASCTRKFYVVAAPALVTHGGMSAVLDAAWARFYQHLPATCTPEQLWSLGVRFAKESLWVETDHFTGFSIGLTLEGGRWVQHPHLRYEIGWCGQNAAYATLLLQDYLWHGDEDSWRRGAAVLDFWANHGRFANGLFYTHFEEKLAGIENPELDTCNLGHGAYQFLLASELAEQAGRPQLLWQTTGLACCDFFTQHALGNGKLGRSWSASGQVIQEDGTSGCTLVWPLTKAYRLTGNSAYLATAVTAYRAYAEDDLTLWQCTAGALDTDCIDKETAFALLLPGIELYEITRDLYFLEKAEEAASYLASWQWHYNLAYPAGSPAAAMNYATLGGTSVSVQHHHLDPWGALIALGWLRLGRATGKSIWAERATAAWRQATIGVSSGDLTLKGIVRPAGGQDEGFYHTRWGGSGWSGMPGDVSDWLVAWPAAFRMITLQHWGDWDVLR